MSEYKVYITTIIIIIIIIIITTTILWNMAPCNLDRGTRFFQTADKFLPDRGVMPQTVVFFMFIDVGTSNIKQLEQNKSTFRQS